MKGRRHYNFVNEGVFEECSWLATEYIFSDEDEDEDAWEERLDVIEDLVYKFKCIACRLYEDFDSDSIYQEHLDLSEEQFFRVSAELETWLDNEDEDEDEDEDKREGGKL